MPLTIEKVEPREALVGQEISFKASVRSVYSLSHPFTLKILSKDGKTLAVKELGELEPGEVKSVEVTFKAELPEGSHVLEADLWVDVNGQKLLDDFAEFTITLKRYRGVLRWLLHI